MNALGNIIIVIGVCVATVGAAGFHDPAKTNPELTEGQSKTESNAIPAFVAGMVLVAGGGAVQRSARKKGTEHEHHVTAAKSEVLRLVMRIRKDVIELDERKDQLPREELCRRLDEILSGDFFDLVDKREDILQVLGFTDYARVWDGVATGERLLSRVWSIATDGYRDEAITNLPAARAHIVRGADALAEIWSDGQPQAT